MMPHVNGHGYTKWLTNGSIESPTIIYEDNTACVAQMQIRYIKSNVTKHQLQESGEINILQIKSCDNFVDLFTKSLSFAIFDKCVKNIGTRWLKDLQGLERVYLWTNPIKYITLYSFPLLVLLYDFS
jgi:hypothetical protein